MPYSAASFTVSFLRAREEERRVGHLHRAGQDRAGWTDLEQLAVPLELVAFGPAPHRADHAQRLFDLGVGAAGVDAHRRHLLQRRAASGAEVEAPVGEHVEHRGPLGDPDRVVVVERHAHDAVPDADALVFAATQVRKISGALMCAYHLSAWCSTAQTRSKPISSASTPARRSRG